MAASPLFTHRLPKVFTKPDEFDPDRFNDERKEDRIAPFTFTSFGGGRHACMGGAFALMQIKIVISTMLRAYSFKLTGPMPGPDFTSMVVGPYPVAVSYTKRAAVLGAA